jgi:CheY-like chemotaxis protein
MLVFHDVMQHVTCSVRSKFLSMKLYPLNTSKQLKHPIQQQPQLWYLPIYKIIQCNRSTRSVILFTNIKNSTPGSPDAAYELVSKPVTLHKLHQAILKTLTAAQGGSPLLSLMWPTNSCFTDPKCFSAYSAAYMTNTATIDATSPLASLRLKFQTLIVDDVVLNQRVILIKLQQRGYTSVDVASSGMEALQAVRTAPIAYDAIFMDVMMPGMDGYETTRLIRSDVRHSQIPIIGITGNCNTETTDACLESGMVAVLAKPIDTERMFFLLESYLVKAQLSSVSNVDCLLSTRGNGCQCSVAAVLGPASSSIRFLSPPFINVDTQQHHDPAAADRMTTTKSASFITTVSSSDDDTA